MKRRANVMFSCADIQVFLLLPTCVFSNESETPMMPLGGLRRIDRRLIHRSAWRDCMKSSWRSPDGGSSVAPNTKIEPSEAVLCAWWGTRSTPFRSFHTVSEGEFCEVGPQGDLEVSGLVLRQPFFDRQYDPFRQHEVRWGCHQPRDQVCHLLWREYSSRRSLLRSTLLALLGREGSPVSAHRSRVEHDRSYAMLLPFVG